MKHLGVWILLVSSLLIAGSWAMEDMGYAVDVPTDSMDVEVTGLQDEAQEPKKGKKQKLSKKERAAKREERMAKKAEREATKAEKEAKREAKKAEKEAKREAKMAEKRKKAAAKEQKRAEKEAERLKTNIEEKGKFPEKKLYLLWEQYLIDLDLKDKLDFSEPEEYKDGFMDYLDDWAKNMNMDVSVVKSSMDKIWTREMRGKNRKDTWLAKILQWTLKGECSAGSLTDEEQSLSTALKAWGEVDIAKDPEDAKVEALTKIMALAKAANLMNDDGKICLCI